MTAKKDLMNRIRGWLPKETKLETCPETENKNSRKKLGLSLRSWATKEVKSLQKLWFDCKLAYRVRLEVAENMSGGRKSHSAIARLGLASILSTFVGVQFLLVRFSFDHSFYNVPASWEVSGVILGLSFGLILGTIPTLKFLKKLEAEKKADFITNSIGLVIFIIIAFAIWMIPIWGTNPPSIYSSEYQYVALVSSITGLITWIYAQFALFLGWELKHKLKIRTGAIYYYAVQKSNNNSPVNVQNKELKT